MQVQSSRNLKKEASTHGPVCPYQRWLGMPSGMDRPPCILTCICHWASRSVGLPHMHTFWPRAYAGFPVYVDPVLPPPPHRRASQWYTILPPAWTGFHVSYSVFFHRASAGSGFPCTHHEASGIEWIPCEPFERTHPLEALTLHPPSPHPRVRARQRAGPTHSVPRHLLTQRTNPYPPHQTARRSDISKDVVAD